MITIRMSEGEWQQLVPGVFFKLLFTDRERGTITSLVKLLPGTYLPQHHHQGIEECLIVEGDFHIDEEVFGPGDYQCALPGSTHQTLYTQNGALVLIVAAHS